jgi:hypothetical protein
MSLPERAVMIDGREGEGLEGKMTQPLERRGRGEPAGGDIGQKGFELFDSHATRETGSR